MSPKSKTRNTKLPFVFINMAVTADGKIATANRAVHSFGSARDLEHLYELQRLNRPVGQDLWKTVLADHHFDDQTRVQAKSG